MAEAAVNALLRLAPRPDLVILMGDATDCGLEEEFTILTALLSGLPMPIYVVPGHHDGREAMRAAFKDRVTCRRQVS